MLIHFKNTLWRTAAESGIIDQIKLFIEELANLPWNLEKKEEVLNNLEVKYKEKGEIIGFLEYFKNNWFLKQLEPN